GRGHGQLLRRRPRRGGGAHRPPRPDPHPSRTGPDHRPSVTLWRARAAIPVARSFRDGRIYRANVTGEANGGGGTSIGMGARYGLGTGTNAGAHGASGVGEACAGGEGGLEVGEGDFGVG